MYEHWLASIDERLCAAAEAEFRFLWFVVRATVRVFCGVCLLLAPVTLPISLGFLVGALIGVIR